MTGAQIQVILIFLLPLAMYCAIRFVPVRQSTSRKKVHDFMRFAIIFTYTPVLYILYGLVTTGFDTMKVLDGETVYTMMMGITIMFGIIMMIGAAIGKTFYWLNHKKII
jgi:hypothetical protein